MNLKATLTTIIALLGIAGMAVDAAVEFHVKLQNAYQQIQGISENAYKEMEKCK